MNILIIENEVYLSHSISQKLNAIGHSCTICVNPNDITLKTQYDVILLSTSSNEDCFGRIQEVYKESMIILLVSYISNDVMSNLLKNGAIDYILKPFMIDQLVSKIEHYFSYKMMQLQSENYENYLIHRYIGSKNKKIDKDSILALLENEDVPMHLQNAIFDNECFLTIEDYFKYIIETNQDKFTDIALAKKLGVSRKCIWEKRKKYEIKR